MTKKRKESTKCMAEKIKKAYLEGYTSPPGFDAARACGAEMLVDVDDFLYKGPKGHDVVLNCKTADNEDFLVDPEGVVF